MARTVVVVYSCSSAGRGDIDKSIHRTDEADAATALPSSSSFFTFAARQQQRQTPMGCANSRVEILVAREAAFYARGAVASCAVPVLLVGAGGGFFVDYLPRWRERYAGE